MPFTITQTTFASPTLRRAFMDYFAELGVTVRDWEGLFQELDKRAGFTLALQDEAGCIVSFLLGSMQDMGSDFFTVPIGFVEEMYVAPAFRQQGLGAVLLQAAEARFRDVGCGYTFLTTDSAPDFFVRQGYLFQPRMAAKNGDPVYVKPLC